MADLRDELKETFGKLFPLVPERDLPWAVCQIPRFLKKRVEFEVEQDTAHFVSEVCRILCEATPPKTHVQDMARNVVDQAKGLGRLKEWLLREAEDVLSKLEKGPLVTGGDMRSWLLRLRRRVIEGE